MGCLSAIWRFFIGRNCGRGWRGVALFALTFGLVAAPLAWYLWSNPGAEFRVGEVSGPLTALRAGDFGPVLQNGLKIAAAFGLGQRRALARGHPRPAGVWAAAGDLLLWRGLAQFVALAR
jgi:hypothetical protein